MVKQEEIMNKKEELRKILCDNIGVLGTNLYVEYINDLTLIVWDSIPDKYEETMKNLIKFEKKLNNTLESLANLTL